jgi:8-oxo-dGTP diphosphatase
MRGTNENRRWYPQNPMVGVGAVVVTDGKLLMVKRAKEPSKGKWSIPGGGIEVGETLEEAVERETLEECSIKVKVEKLLDATQNILRDENGRVKFHFVIVDFVCKYISGVARARSDAGECRWVPQKEIETLDVSSTLRDMLKRKGVI